MFCQFFTVIPEKANDFIAVVQNPNTDDLEDGLQIQCATKCDLDYIVTRNIDDFKKSSVPAILSSDFLAQDK